MKLSTELRNLPIVSIAEGEEVGMVKDFIVDPDSKAVVALVIADASWYSGAKVISFSLINSIGDYAITTENASSVVELSNMPELIELLKKELKIIDSRVITRGGRFIGRIKEYSLDKETGHILGLELASDSEIASPDQNIIPAQSIVTIGKDVIIVNDEVEADLKTNHAELSGGAPAAPAYTPPAPAPAPEPEPVIVDEPDVEEMPEPVAEVEIGDDVDMDIDLDQDPEDMDIEDLLDLDSGAEAEGLVDEPAEEAPVLEEPAEDSKESLSEIFERRQIKYMLGKKVSRDIATDDGISIAAQGEEITDDIISKAKKSGKFLELSMNIEIED